MDSLSQICPSLVPVHVTVSSLEGWSHFSNSGLPRSNMAPVHVTASSLEGWSHFIGTFSQLEVSHEVPPEFVLMCMCRLKKRLMPCLIPEKLNLAPISSSHKTKLESVCKLQNLSL